MQPMGMPSRSLKAAMDFLALVTTGFCPVMAASSAEAESSSLMFWMASPNPRLMMIFSSRGACMGLL